MSREQYQENLPSTPSILLPADFSDVIQDIASDIGVDLWTLTDEALNLGLRFVTSSLRGAEWFTQEAGGPVERIDPSPTDFSYSFKTPPAKDAVLLGNLEAYRNKVSGIDRNLQTAASLLVGTAAQSIRERFGIRLEPEHHLILKHISEGVLVIDNLKGTSPEDDSQSNVIVSGRIVESYNAVLLDRNELERNKVSPEEKLSTATHEVWHVLSENNLPGLLNEALTDILTERTIGYPADQIRLGGNFRLAFKLLKQLERITGEDEVLQAYLNSPYTEVTMDLATRTITRTFIDLPLHQHLRRALGKDHQGNEHWDQILDLIDQEKLEEAYDLCSKRPFTQKVKEYIQHYSGFFRRLKPAFFLGR